jgi:hypothetical protein
LVAFLPEPAPPTREVDVVPLFPRRPPLDVNALLQAAGSGAAAAAAAAAVLRAEFEGHMKECDRRYGELEKTNSERHVENRERFLRQDSILNRILWGIVSLLLGFIGMMADMAFRYFTGHA